MTCPDKSRRSSGFTLLEILLSLALTALLLTLLSAGVYAVVRDWDDNYDGLERSLDQTVSLLQIERALQGAFPHSFRDPRTLGRYIYFDGEYDRLSWVSTVSPGRRGGLTAWRLSAEPNGDVYLQLAPALSDDPVDRLDAAEPALLLEGYTLSFSYLYEAGDGNKLWREDWNGEEILGLPLAVHLLLTPTDRVARTEALDIVAPIRATDHRSINRNPLAER